MEREWHWVELPHEEADGFRRFLRANEVKHETSECFNLIHFEVLVNIEESSLIDGYLEALD